MNIKSKIFCLIMVCTFQNTSTGQLTCDYIPLEFEDMTPKWNHVVIDTSIIGYVIEDAVFNGGDVFYNGMHHFDRDLGSFVEGEYLYSITGIMFDLDLVGYIIEKINLDDGALVWKSVTDLRTETQSLKVMDAQIKNGKLVLQGVRPVVEDSFVLGLLIGRVDSYLFRREYDIETGELLSSFTPDNEVEDLHVYWSWSISDYIKFGEETNDHFKLNIGQDVGLHLARSIVDVNGTMIVEKDTIISGMYNDIYDQTLVKNENFKSKIAAGPENTFLYLEEFIPISSSDEETRGMLTKYDYDFNVISTFDLLDLPVKDFESIWILEYSEERIVLQGCHNAWPWCDYFYYVLDHDYNLLNYTSSQVADEFVYGVVYQTEYYRPDNQMVIAIGRINEEDNSKVTIYTSNNEQKLDSIRGMTIVEDNWATVVSHFEQLENGDWLIKFSHGCHSNHIYRNRYQEWMRFDEEEFDLMTSASNADLIDSHITVAPNPAQNHIRIDISDDTAIDRIVIYNIQGQQMSVYHEVSDAIEVDISKWSSGTYILQYQLSDGNRSQVKFVKM